ncbi:nucleotidyltransferase [Massilimicrobiota timonensis]|uniref:nucleotidyltransferase domain-containing protein n=1 Tax=Massilimicrobiota timonensis TaxID=1776392 RepID=UPI0036F238B5
MANFSEETLKSWYKPASETEDTKINNVINMIKKAIQSSDEFDSLKYEIFVQGSYGNNTNVRVNSDVDVNVMLTSTFFTCYPEGKNDADYSFSEGTISYSDYKERVIRALKKKFGADSISLGNKSVKISSNSYRVNADCVISMQYRNYNVINSTNPNNYVEGIKYFANDGKTVINYPKEHIENGNSKNVATNHQYKKLVRIFKRVRNKMSEEGLIEKDKITSFLVECLVWNIPNTTITKYSTWNETVKQAIIYLYHAIKDNKCSEWGEVSDWLYLFHSSRKWTKDDAQDFLLKMWIYMGYGNENN